MFVSSYSFRCSHELRSTETLAVEKVLVINGCALACLLLANFSDRSRRSRAA